VDWGDGSPTLTTDNPLQCPPSVCSHQYIAVGTYTVTVVATNLNGTSLPVTHTITVNPPNPGPVAEFTWSPMTNLTAPQPVNFTDTTQNTPNQWSWDFGDSSPLVTTQNPSHTFATANTFTIILTATSPYGSSQVSHQITVSAPVPQPHCVTPDFKPGGSTKWTTTQITSLWTAPQPPDNRVFSGPLTYQSTPPQPPSKFHVLAQSLPVGSNPLCSAGIVITWGP